MSDKTDATSATTESRTEGKDLAQRVGIIGAGIAGLVTAKIFLENGFDVQVFEKEPDLGGVWALSRAYPGLRANTAKETYSLTDYPLSGIHERLPGCGGSTCAPGILCGPFRPVSAYQLQQRGGAPCGDR